MIQDIFSLKQTVLFCLILIITRATKVVTVTISTKGMYDQFSSSIFLDLFQNQNWWLLHKCL